MSFAVAVTCFDNLVIELPIRDGNQSTIIWIKYSRTVIELPIRDGNVGQ